MVDESRVLELLERGHALSEGERCLGDATLEALADGSIPQAEAAAASAHLRDCLACLHAYAAVRALLELEPPIERPAFRRLAAARIPLGWAVAAAAAAMVLTWILATAVGRERPPAGGIPRMIELAGQQSPQTVSGAVETVEDANAAAVAAHVLGIAGEDGRRYKVFVWGSPTSRVGDRVSVEGHFGTVDESAGASVQQGVAIRLHVDARP